MRLDEVEQPITNAQLNALEKALDKLFASLNIDVEFTRHFIDRANDDRNGNPITMSELVNMFRKEYRRWGKPIAQMGPDAEAVMKDLESDINIPFVLKWDRDNEELDLVAKTVMRKKNFKTSNKEFPVESKTYNTMSNVGKAKYVVNFHDGEKTHKDGSRFYDMSTFKNAKDLESFEKQLKSKGYVKETKVEEMPIPKSTMYGLVIDGEYVAKGSKEKMRSMQKQKGGTVYNAPGKKVGDKEGTVKEDETPKPMRRISDEEKLAVFNELKAGDTVHLWYDSSFKRGEKYKPFKMGRRTKSEKYNLSKFSMQQISAEGIPAGVKFFLYKRGDKVSLAMGDMAATLVDMQTDLGEYKISSKKPLSSLGGYGNKKLAKKQPAVGDGMSEDEVSEDDFYLIVEYEKGKPVKQSDPLRVLDNLAARNDNMPFPIKFKDGGDIKVTPELAKRFTMAYHDIARPEQKEMIKQYLRTKEGFMKIVKQMQLKKPDFGKNAGANMASLDRNVA
ncbi:MAG: hypothetical protein CMD92_07280 [Gammaproteobacteria bacterium]|nr:hypothetical protein [Gammaproteobacteria bacterium]